MVTLKVGNVDDAVVNALAARAERQGRTVEAEHLELLKAALLQPQPKSLVDALLSIPDVGRDQDFERNAEALLVRPLHPTDLQPYRSLMLHAYASAPDAFTSTPEERALEPEAWWLRRIADPSGLSIGFGAFVGGALVGTVTIEFAAKPKTRHKAHVIGMFVSEQARGCGAGRALMKAALDAARARPGVKLVTLTVTEGNAPAVALYEACGFKAFGVEPMAIWTGSDYRAKVHMWLALG